jgi:transposase-like protein
MGYMDGKKEVLGLYIGGSESAKYWLSILNEIKTRGVKEAYIFCADNLTGIKDAIKAAYGDRPSVVHSASDEESHKAFIA